MLKHHQFPWEEICRVHPSVILLFSFAILRFPMEKSRLGAKARFTHVKTHWSDSTYVGTVLDFWVSFSFLVFWETVYG
jgi:hypothetical protein